MLKRTSKTGYSALKVFTFTVQPTACCAGPCCLKVVLMLIGGTTAMLRHCSGSWATWIALVANPLGCAQKPSSPTALREIEHS